MSSSRRPLLSEEPPQAAACELKNNLEGQAAVWLADYTRRLRRRGSPLDEKVINDAVWGSVRLYPWEVAVADSPLMQRLRSIRQLGVVHWIYPNATHSRFEHSIGVAHAVQKILDGIEKNSGIVGQPIVDAGTRYLMRLAGLVHDCGHTVMSHASEPIVASLRGADDLGFWFRETYGLRKRPSVSEVFAAVFVRSPAFCDLLAAPAVGADFIRQPSEACEILAGLLLGGPAISDRPFLTLVINGPFDADKLDYMQRDAMMAGVPSALDVSRLLEKIHVVDLPPGEKPEFDDYRRWAGVPETEAVGVLALPRSATSVLDELSTGRTTLHEKVYFHHKARAIEAQARNLLQARVEKQELSVGEWLELGDETALQWKEPIAKHLRERQLLKRAFHFSAAEHEDDGEHVGAHGFRMEWSTWRQLRRATRPSSDKLRDLNNRLLVAAKEAARLLGCEFGELDSQPPAIDLPPVKELDQFAFLGDSFRDLELANAAIAGQRSETGKRLARFRGYVYGPETCLIAVFFGALKVLAIEFGLRLSESTYSNTKLEPNELRSAFTILRRSDFFRDVSLDGFSRDLESEERSHQRALLEKFLKVAWPRILVVSENLGRYQSLDGEPVSGPRIASYLRQFESPARARVALRLLESLDFKDRQFFVKALDHVLSKACSAGSVSFVCPLGSTGDSSAMLSYLMGDLRNDLQAQVLQLELALEEPKLETIVLWDDFCGQAGHSITTLAQWLSAEKRIPKCYLLNEDLARPLGQDRADRFRRTKVLVGFAVATPDGLERLRNALQLLGLENVEIVDPFGLQANRDELRNDASVFRSQEEAKDFYQFMNERAREIHARKTAQWGEHKLSSRLRGYGNFASRMVFFYNVPTVTLTIIWGQGNNWEPLLPRRSKPTIGPASCRLKTVSG